MRHRFQVSFRRVLLFHLLEIRVQAIQLLAISRGSRNAPSRTPGHGRYFPGMLLSPSPFGSRSAIRPRNLPSSSSRLSRGYNRAPRGADAAEADVSAEAATWTRAVRGMRVLRLRDMQRGCAVICLPLQHYFQLHYCQSCNRSVVMEPHDGFTVCPEMRTPRRGRGQAAFHHHGASVSGKTGMFAPARPGRGCYRVLRRGTVTVAQ
jgi:hypothetical protein